MELIDKDALVVEIKRIMDEQQEICKADVVLGKTPDSKNIEVIYQFQQFTKFLDALEVKEAVEYEQPEYSYFDTIYRCGKKPRWNAGDKLAYYEFYADREGECVLDKVIKVGFDEDYDDWSYTFEDGSVLYEGFLLSEETYKL